MAFDLKNIKLKFSGPDDDVLGDFIREIANGGLGTYRRIIQYGNKQGQPLYAHVVDLVFTFARLADYLGLNVIEQRVMMLALSAHDINKIGDRYNLRFADLASQETISQELHRLGADRFFPTWRNYLDDIVTLILSHSDHFHHGSGLLFAPNIQAERYALGERVQELSHLMKGLDALDLSHDLEERKHKATFLSHLNAICDTQYYFVYHTVAEQRGILTNVIHNRIAEFMAQKKGLLPLLYYPGGVCYLASKSQHILISETDISQISASVAEFLEAQTRGSFETFIKAGPQGIKIDQKCLELGIPFRQLWTRVDAIIQGKNYATVDDMEQKARGRANTKLEQDQSTGAQSLRRRLDQERLLPSTREQLRLGELMRSYYIFLSKHFKKQFKDPWSHIYQLLEVNDELQAIYAYFDPNYDRSYVVAGDISLRYDDVIERLLTDGEKLLDEQQIESPWSDIFADYARQQIGFSFQPPQQADFAMNLQRYMTANHRQSAYGSSLLPADAWRSGDVAKTIKVQQFSNRLEAGPGDPVKNVDPITRAQFLLEKLNYSPGYEATTYYMHIFPYAFFADAYLRTWRDTVRELATNDVSALFLKTDEILRNIFDDTAPIEISASGVKSNGLPLPGASEVLGNLLIWPLNAPGANDTERFWYAFTCAYAMHRFVGGRVVLTRSAVPILSKDEVESVDLFTDEIPIGLRGLLRQNAYNYQELPDLEKLLAAIYEIQRHVGRTTDELMPLLRSLNDGPLGVYFAAERLLLKRIKSDKKLKAPEWFIIQESRMIADSLRIVANSQGGLLMNETIQRLAQLAWEGNLKGQSLEKNSLMTPLDHCFEKLQLWQEPIDQGTLRAVTITDIYSYLERTREKGMVGDATRQKAQAFVDVFYNDLLDNIYKGNRSRLLTDEKLIRSAFLFHIREQVAKASNAKKDQAKTNQVKTAG